MLDKAWCCIDTFATLSLDVILYIYICMLCEIICNKLCNYVVNFFKKTGVKSQCIQISRGNFAWANLSLLSPFDTITCCSRNRGKLKLRFKKNRGKITTMTKVGVKSQLDVKVGARTQ